MLDIRFSESFFKVITGEPKNSTARITKLKEAAIKYANNFTNDFLMRDLLGGIIL